MNNRNLLIFLVLCVAIYFVVQWYSQGKQSTFRTNITDLDTAEVDRLWIQKGESAAFEILETEGQWEVKEEDKTVLADKQAVRSTLATLRELKVESIVAKKESNWADYKVDVPNATHLKIYAGGQLLNELFLGKFDFDKQTRSAASFVRPADASTVYKVNGMISMAFQQGATYFYNKTLVNIPQDKVTGMRYTFGDRQDEIQRRGEDWYTTGGKMIDSSAIRDYLGLFSPLKAYQMANIAEGDFSGIPGMTHRLNITTQGGGSESIEAKYYEKTKRFLVRSSQYPETVYASDSSGLYKRVFQSFPVKQLAGEAIQ